MARVRSGTVTEVEHERFESLHRERARRVLDMDPEELVRVQEVDETPGLAGIFTTVACEQCGEGVMEARARRLGGRDRERFQGSDRQQRFWGRLRQHLSDEPRFQFFDLVE